MKIFIKLGDTIGYLRNSLVRNSYFLILANVIVAGASYVFWILLARLSGQEVVGVSSAFLSAMAVLGLIASVGLENGLIRFLPEKYEENILPGFISISIGIRSVISLLAGIIFILGIKWWTPALLPYLHDPIMILLFIILVVANGLYQLFNGVFVSFRKAHFVSLANIIYNGIEIIVLLLITGKVGVTGIIILVSLSLIITNMVSVIIIIFQDRNGWKKSKHIQFNMIKEFIKFSFSNYIVEIFLGLPILVLPLFVINILGPITNAIFYIVWMTSNLLRTFSVSISQSTFAEGSVAPENLAHTLRHGVNLILLVNILGGGGLLLFTPFLISLFGSDYQAGIPLMFWLIISKLPFAFFVMVITVQRIRKRNLSIIGLSLSWSILSLVCSWIGLRVGGLNGVIIGWSISQFAVLPLCISPYMKEIRKSTKISI